MKHIYLIIITCLFSGIAQSQSYVTIKGQITDSLQNPIENVHICLQGTGIGTISNKQGNYVLKIDNKFKQPLLEVSHIGYNKLIKAVTHQNAVINIQLNKKSSLLKEAAVTALSTSKIIEKTIQNLKQNYEVDAVEYTIFGRITEEIKNQPILLEEMVFNLYHENDNKPDFHVLKIRGKGYNKLGRQRFKSSRLIDIQKTASHIMLRYIPDFLKRRKRKKYQYKLERITNDSYVITVNSDRYLKGGEIHINKTDFGISYLKKVYADEEWRDFSRKNTIEESFYKKIGNKWFFSHGTEKNDFFYSEGQFTVTEIQNVVVIDKQKKCSFAKSEKMESMVKKTSKYKSGFNDHF